MSHSVATFALCALLLCVGYRCPAVGAAIIAKSQIQHCTDDGKHALDCGKKLVVSLSVDADLKPGAESINFLSSATDETAGMAKVEFDPIQLTISRSSVFYRYPSFYVASFNANPYELTEKGSLADLCDDSFTTKASCGLQYTWDGTPIPYSQGYCCTCGACSGVRLCGANARSALACNIFSDYSVATCLRFGDLWYNGYSLGQANLWFTIELTFTRNSTKGLETSTLRLSPENLDASDASFGAMAQIVGTFASTVEPLYLADKYLFIPDSKDVVNDVQEYLLLPNTMVTLDGTECNKVGVSYYAFNSQGNRCEMEAGSCLQNQLVSLRDKDKMRVAAGKKPAYLLSGYGDATTTPASEGVEAQLNFAAPAPPSTMITVTIKADEMEYIVAVAPGKILSAKLNMDVVEAQTKDAVMTVELMNTGSIVAEYTLSVHNCSEGVFPIPSRRLTIKQGETSSLQFDVLCQSDVAQDAECVVTLLDAVKEETDHTSVQWKVIPVTKTKGAQGDTVVETGRNEQGDGIQGSCDNCSIVNVVCSVSHKCMGKSFGFFLFVAAAIGACVLLFLLRSRLGCCCFLCKRKKKGNRRDTTTTYREPAEYADNTPCQTFGLGHSTSSLPDWKPERRRLCTPPPRVNEEDAMYNQPAARRSQRLAASLSLREAPAGAAGSGQSKLV